MKWIIGIVVLAVLCLLAILNGFIITRYRTGELEDIWAVQERFVLYSQVPFFKTEGWLYFLERVTQPYHRLMSLEFLPMTLMSLKTARIYRILSHPLQAFFIQRKRLLVFHQKLKNFCFRILGTEIIHWAKKGRNNKSRNFGSARPGLTASSVSTWKPRSSS